MWSEKEIVDFAQVEFEEVCQIVCCLELVTIIFGSCVGGQNERSTCNYVMAFQKTKYNAICCVVLLTCTSISTVTAIVCAGNDFTCRTLYLISDV